MLPAEPSGMAAAPQLRTGRLLLGPWRETDRDPFASLNADPEVMEHFAGPLSREESDALIDHIEAGFARHGFGLWTVAVVATAELLGVAGRRGGAFVAR